MDVHVYQIIHGCVWAYPLIENHLEMEWHMWYLLLMASQMDQEQGSK